MSDNRLTMKQEDRKVLVKSKVALKKSSLKYFIKKFLSSKKLRREISVSAHPNMKAAYVLNAKKQ